MSMALFLDRDGVINHDAGYTHKKENFVFMDGIFELCAAFEQAGFLIFVITNQAGIARGYYTEQEFLELTGWMERKFAEKGIRIAKTYYCPFHPDGVIEKYKCNSIDRKPNPGMILKARGEFGITLSKSVLIGDRGHDIEAGKAAGVGRNVIIGETCVAADLSFANINEAIAAKIWEM